MDHDPCSAGCLRGHGTACHARVARVRRFCELIAEGRADYAQLVDRLTAGLPPAPFAPPPIHRGAPLPIRAHLHAHGGYGQMCAALGRSLESLGVPVVFDPIAVDESFIRLDEFSRSRIVSSPPSPWVLNAVTPESPPPEGRAVAWLSMYESTRLRPEYVANLNRAVAVIVPCAWNAEHFAASGVTRPIHTVPLGIDPAEYHPVGPPPPGPCVFGVAGRMAHGGSRKGIAEAVAAFLDAFPRGEPGSADVRLSVKVWPDCPLAEPDDDRVEVIRRPMSTAELADWYRSLTAYLTLSCAEGWGLIPLQAMACGRPALMADYSGHAEYFHRASCYAIEYDEVPATGYYAGTDGLWGKPRHESAVEQLRRVYRDRDEAARKGEAAAARAREFTWQRSARKLRDTLEAISVLCPKTRGSLASTLAPAPGRR